MMENAKNIKKGTRLVGRMRHYYNHLHKKQGGIQAWPASEEHRAAKKRCPGMFSGSG